MAIRLGGERGTVVARKGQIYWGLLFSVLVGAPVYAFFQGWIRMIQGAWGFVTSLASGPGEFLGELVGGLLDAGARTIGASWWSFLAETKSFAGPFTFLVTVAAVMFVLATVLWGVSRWR